MSDRIQLWSCGGGRQSAGIAALIAQGRLPRPDHVCMVAIEWEMKSTYRYVCDCIRPTMQAAGVPFTFIPRKKYASYGFWAGADGNSLLLPAHSNQSGQKSKLPEFCSPRKKWFAPSYPLLDVVPMHVSGCLAAVEAMGWPEPPRSRCHHCPNQSDAEWAQLTPQEWESACTLDESIREVDPHAYLHKQMIPLRMVALNPKVDDGLFSGGCSSGTCY